MSSEEDKKKTYPFFRVKVGGAELINRTQVGGKTSPFSSNES